VILPKIFSSRLAEIFDPYEEVEEVPGDPSLIKVVFHHESSLTNQGQFAGNIA
jgi:hypothetical protein